jgi:hypothetical protein
MLQLRLEEFWHGVCAEETAHHTGAAGPEARRLPDVRLVEGDVAVALAPSGEIVGTCMIVTSDPASMQPEDVPVHAAAGAARSARIDLLLIDREWRQKSALTLDLCRSAYARALELGASRCHIHIPLHQRAFFERLGFREQPGTDPSEEVRKQCAMRLDVEDYDHLMAVRSPFAPILAAKRWLPAGDESPQPHDS